MYTLYPDDPKSNQVINSHNNAIIKWYLYCSLILIRNASLSRGLKRNGLCCTIRLESLTLSLTVLFLFLILPVGVPSTKCSQSDSSNDINCCLNLTEISV